MLARRLHTREWWDLERDNFDIWTLPPSPTQSCARARFPRQRECQRMVRRLRYLPVTATVSEVAEEICSAWNRPLQIRRQTQPIWQLQTFHEIDYVLSWNYAHMVNPSCRSGWVSFASRPS